MANNSSNTQIWTMEKIIENADNWSLAGDVALLNSMKAFADNLLSQTVKISSNVDNLLNNLNNVSLKLDLSKNEFQSLRNTQFIESRVYEDDDETVEVREENKNEEKPISEEEKDKIIKESITRGLQVIENYFDKVEVSISDSEEESVKSYVLRAKDVYADRPLPLLVGSEEWYKKWHVGLVESSSESESEKEMDYSDSDSEDVLLKDRYGIKGSETGSDFSSTHSASLGPAANSTFNDSARRRRDVFHSSDESEDHPNSVPDKAPISNQSFAEKLAAKLGNVISQQENVVTEINKNPIQKSSNANKLGLFSDDPPPLDDFDTILPKHAQSGLFSGGTGLFDDDGEDELFWGQQNRSSSNATRNQVVPEGNKNLFGDEVDSEQNISTSRSINNNISGNLAKSQATKGLFDSPESSDEDIFSTNLKRTAAAQPFLQPFKTTAPLFDEEPPELEPPKKIVKEDITQKKKPIGGVSIFGNTDIFINKNLKTQSNIEALRKEPRERTLSEINQTDITSSQQKERSKETQGFDAKKNPIKKYSLFDDDGEIFNNDDKLFARRANLFDDLEDTPDTKGALKVETTGEDERKNAAETLPQKRSTMASKLKKNVSLFDSSSEGELEEDIFGVKEDKKEEEVGERVKEDKKEEKVQTPTDKIEENVLKSNTLSGDKNKSDEIDGEKKTAGLFDDDLDGDDIFTGYNSENSGEKAGKEKSSSFEEDDIFKGYKGKDVETKDKENVKGDVLFEENGDSFSGNKSGREGFRGNGNATENPVVKVTEATPKTDEVSASRSQGMRPVNLFDPTPPPDDDWDTKSDNASDNDNFSYNDDYNSPRRYNLFDNEPPSLDPNESSGIVRDQNVTRVDTTDESSFYPYASSSRRLSSDVFGEQQSNDSFFITKNKTEIVVQQPPSLQSVPETPKKENKRRTAGDSEALSITPSGNASDFAENTSSKSAGSVFEHDDSGTSTVADDSQKTEPSAGKAERKKPTLFGSDNENSDSDDLFSYGIRKKAVDICSINTGLFVSDVAANIQEQQKDADDEKDRQKCDGGENDHNKEKQTDSKSDGGKSDGIPKEDCDNKSKKDSVEGEIVSSSNKVERSVRNNVANITERFQNPSRSENGEKSKTKGSPGKLKHNLNINVGALMPGMAPPKLRDNQSKSLDADDTPPGSSTSTPDTSDVRKEEKPVGFDAGGENVEVLQSITKDRARIPIKRRPSTRRGRREAIRKSGADFSLYPNEDDRKDDEGTREREIKNEENRANNEENVKKTDTITAQEKTPANEETVAERMETEPNRKDKMQGKMETEISVESKHVFDEDINIKPMEIDRDDTHKRRIFDDPDDSEDDLFSAKKPKPKSVETKKPESLFADSPLESDDDLFGTKGAATATKRVTEKPKKVAEKSKKSLFGDDSSDEDLFDSAGGSKSKVPVVKPIEKKPIKTSTIKKLENIQADEDPLSSLLK